MAERCLELLNLPESGPPHYLLDIGCGTGFSTAVLQDAGHYCVGTDISESMLLVGQEEETDEDGNAHLTDTLVNDIGQGTFSPRSSHYDQRLTCRQVSPFEQAHSTVPFPFLRYNGCCMRRAKKPIHSSGWRDSFLPFTTC